MDRQWSCLAGVIALFLALGAVTRADQPAERPIELGRLVDALGLTERGVRSWLQRLGADADYPVAERLLAVSLSGELLVRREGAASSVRVDPELDLQLRRPDQQIVLVHNHPTDAGLSLADLELLDRPGLAAIVAVGHGGSVFVASAGPHFDRGFFATGQHARTNADLVRRLRQQWPSRVSAADSYAHLSHLLALVFADVGVLRYWFELRGAGRDSYERGRFAFNMVVDGAAGSLRKQMKSRTDSVR